MAKFFDLSFEKFEGDLGKDARPVPGLSIGIQSAAMSELANATDGSFQD
jgi:hypothetical protein